jgi:hypothetical protein
VFATEGGTAAMCYIFDSCQINGLLKRGDRIAIMAPIFTPYLEIPRLDRYSFKVTELRATKTNEDGFHTWQYPDAELEKLADPSIKALFLVHPTNPPSVKLSAASMKKIVSIVRTKNPGLTIMSTARSCRASSRWYASGNNPNFRCGAASAVMKTAAEPTRYHWPRHSLQPRPLPAQRRRHL